MKTASAVVQQQSQSQPTRTASSHGTMPARTTVELDNSPTDTLERSRRNMAFVDDRLGRYARSR